MPAVPRQNTVVSNQLRFFARRASCSPKRRSMSMLKIARCARRQIHPEDGCRFGSRLRATRHPRRATMVNLNFMIFIRSRGSEHGISIGFGDRTIASFTPYRTDVESCHTSRSLKSKYDVAENAGKELLSHSSANARAFNATSGPFPRAMFFILLREGMFFAKLLCHRTLYIYSTYLEPTQAKYLSTSVYILRKHAGGGRLSTMQPITAQTYGNIPWKH